MKKTLLIIFAIFGALLASAQEKESVQDTTAAPTIESLSAKLDKLQHDYDFLNCEYQLHETEAAFNDLINTTNISANGLTTYCLVGIFDRELYGSYVDNYKSKCDLFEALKSKYDTIKVFVVIKSVSSGFTKEEMDVLKSKLGVIERCITAANASLTQFDMTIQTYKRTR